MVVAGRVVTEADGSQDVAIMMIEAEATDNAWNLIQAGGVKPDETVIAQGIEASKPFIKQLVEAQQQVAATAAKPTADYPTFPPYQADDLRRRRGARLRGAQGHLPDRREGRPSGRRRRAQGAASRSTSPRRSRAGELPESANAEVSAAYKSVTKLVVRSRVLEEGVRIDGRGLADIRPLDAEVQVVPRVHGSAIFQRGETQILGVTTLNMLKLEQQIDSLSPVTKKRYMHNYNFPPYSTGETGRVGSPKRREIGHGALAERALVPVLPTREEFPYAIRQVSEALGSNGSTSMGSVCASTLSLLNAGVPLRAPVAGIAMGLISDTVNGETRYAALTDILGAEDALGDMDFKVAGTSEFVTAIQLDTKLDGIPASVLAGALTQAKDARTTILAVLNAAIDGPDEMAPTAPRVISVQIPVDKIGELIGPKGKTINAIQDETGADISIEEDGTVYIGATDGPSAEAARAQVNAIANPTNPEVGEQFLGTVVKIAAFGAFISLLPGKDGLLHISEVRKLAGGKRVENVEDVLGVGQKILVEITKIDDRGKLSLAPVLAEEADTDASRGDRHARRRPRRGCRRLVAQPHARMPRPIRSGGASVVAGPWSAAVGTTSGRRSMTGTSIALGQGRLGSGPSLEPTQEAIAVVAAGRALQAPARQAETAAHGPVGEQSGTGGEECGVHRHPFGVSSVASPRTSGKALIWICTGREPGVGVRL